MLAAFRRHYRIDESVTVVGPFSGQLSNAGENVQLTRAHGPRLDESDEFLMLLEDAVSYDDETPWDVRADGYGHSLHRRGISLWGDNVNSWVSGWPTPGRGVLVAGDANGSGQFDQLDIVRLLQSGKYRTGQPASWEQGDFTGDGVFDQLDIVAALQAGNYLQGLHALQAIDELFSAISG